MGSPLEDEEGSCQKVKLSTGPIQKAYPVCESSIQQKQADK
jgi:hypothetical protein